MRLYHDSAFDFTRPAPSYWQASAPPLSFAPRRFEGARRADVAIIGGGYAGLSAALALARRHGVEAVVLEAGEPAWGASGRNGGFCSAGSAKLSYGAMIRRHGLEATREFYSAQRDSVEHVRDFLAAEAIDAEQTSGGDYRLAHAPSRVEALRAEAEFMNLTFGTRQQFLSRAELAERGKGAEIFHAGLHDPQAFGLHPLKYARGLAAAVNAAGVPIFARSPVTGWRRDGGRHVLTTGNSEVSAGKVLLATNGYTPEGLLPWAAGRPLPALSRILVTRPITASEQAAQGWTGTEPAHDTRTLLHYFRLLPDGRFLFGGRGGLDASAMGLERSLVQLRNAFETMFPAWAGAPTEHAWAGFVCLTRPLTPYAGPIDDMDGAYAAFGWHGNGVAMASHAGGLMADVIAGARSLEEAIPAVMRAPLPRFPVPALRRWMLAGAYLAASIGDRRS